MKKGKPSNTAEAVAIHRAVESMKPQHRRVCYDPFAVHFLGTTYRVIAKIPLLREMVYWLLAERQFPGVIGEVLVRTRYIDDYLAECIGNGIKQLVILGAGYDSRAYRTEGIDGRVKVFEVDHPSTQKRKTQRLHKVLGSLPGHVIYVPIDFSEEKLDQRLFQSGYDKNLKTLFIWEGVTYYLTAKAVDETLAFVVDNSGEGSSIIFNYMHQSFVDATYDTEEARRIREDVAERGEPYVFGIKEGTIDNFLTRRGFCQVKNATPEFLQSTYFKGVNQGRRVCPYTPTVHAMVKPRAVNESNSRC